MKLRAGETLAYKTRLHWIVFGRSVWLASPGGWSFSDLLICGHFTEVSR